MKKKKQSKLKKLKEKTNIKVVISGGGTGGHIFPALAIADEIKERQPDAEILFIGANGRMEMEKVPTAGYKIVGLPVQGLIRRFTFRNLQVIRNYFKSQKMAAAILKEFKPDLAIGVGGYASAPTLKAAAAIGVPCLLQEQNSYAGVTNKMLAKKARKICVAYEGMEKFFPADRIIYTGNPVRRIELSDQLRKEAREYFNIDNENPVLLVVGGSLGARTINQAVLANLSKITSSRVNLIWQTGKYYYDSIQNILEGKKLKSIQVHPFITRMDLAYNIADLVISRSGALSISELCLMGKASVLVPSPNVAEDHQSKNAMALVNQSAAVLVEDHEAESLLFDKAISLLTNEKQLKELGANCRKLAKPNATKDIVDVALKLIKE